MLLERSFGLARSGATVGACLVAGVMTIAMDVVVLEGAAITVFVLTGRIIFVIGFNAAGIV